MNVVDKIKELMTQIKSLWGAITDLQDGVDIAGSHDLLSSTHPDTTVGSPVRGDLVTGQNVSPVWKKKALGTTGKVVQSDGSDVIYDDVAWANVKKVGSSIADLATHSHAVLSGIGEDDHHNKVHALDSTTEHSALSNNTDHNVSITKHGLCPLLPNDDTKFLSGKGTWLPGGGGGAGATFDPDEFPASPTSQSDHFDDASIDVKWVAWQAGGNLTVAESNHHLVYTNTGDNAYTWRGHFQALPAGDFTIEVKVNPIFPFANYLSVGLALYQDATNNPNTTDVFAYTCEMALGTPQTRVTYLNAYNSWGYSPSDMVHSNYCPSYLRIRRSGTTLYFDHSTNGIQWLQQYTVAQPFAAAEMGLIMWNYANAVTGIALFDWFYYLGSNSLISPVGA